MKRSLHEDGGGDWGGVAVAKNASSHWALGGGVGWTLPWCPRREHHPDCGLQASSIVTE